MCPGSNNRDWKLLCKILCKANESARHQDMFPEYGYTGYNYGISYWLHRADLCVIAEIWHQYNNESVNDIDIQI